jgi:hypothetical protein
MKIQIIKSIVVILFVAIACFSFKFPRPAEVGPEVPYPEGYRRWTHIKTGLVTADNPNFKTNGGYHHIYGNDQAMEGYQSGKFPDGSIIVFDLLDIKVQNGNIQEGDRKHLDVMVKNSAKYPDTGGWGYEEFSGDSQTERSLTTAAKTQCFTCHAKKDDFVFSEFRK